MIIVYKKLISFLYILAFTIKVCVMLKNVYNFVFIYNFHKQENNKHI
jgi:hypothetical protein